LLQIIIASTVLFIEISRTFYVCLPIVHKMAPTWGLWRGGKRSGPTALWQSNVILTPLSCQDQDTFRSSSGPCHFNSSRPSRIVMRGADRNALMRSALDSSARLSSVPRVAPATAPLLPTRRAGASTSDPGPPPKQPNGTPRKKPPAPLVKVRRGRKP